MRAVNAERAAAFEFARRLPDREFRKFLKDHGCSNEQDVVIALDGTLASEVLDRIFTRSKPPALVAIRRPMEPLGFAFMTIRPGIQDPNHPSNSDAAEIAGKTTIGVLFDWALSNDPHTFDVGSRWAYSLEPARSHFASA